MRSVGTSTVTSNLKKSDQFPLQKSVLLDSGANLDIFRDVWRFRNYTRATFGDYVWTGGAKVPIEGYGTSFIRVQTHRQSPFHLLSIPNAAHCPDFLCNVASVRKLKRRGFWWDQSPGNNCLRRPNRTLLADVKDVHEQFLLEHNLPRNQGTALVAQSSEHHQNSSTPYHSRAPQKAIAKLWHLRTGHPNAEALQRLVSHSIGVKVKGPTTVECEQCATSKARRVISRAPKERPLVAGEIIAVDFHDFNRALDNSSSMMLLTDRCTGMMWDYYLENRTANSINVAFSHFLDLWKKQYAIEVKIIESDNEITTQKPAVARFIQSFGIRIETSAPYTQSQNGLAERSGGVIKDKMRAMRGHLPKDIWPEIGRAAIYLSNRLPRYGYKWKSPYENFFGSKPYNSHLRAYGCRAYALTRDAMTKSKRLDRLAPKAWIGYLVGYCSINQYRIWVPFLNQVITRRDVTFDEQTFFDGNLEKDRMEVKNMTTEDIAKILQLDIESGSRDRSPNISDDSIEATGLWLTDPTPPLTDYGETMEEPVGDYGNRTDQVHNIPYELPIHTNASFEFLPTPPATPPNCLLAVCFTGYKQQPENKSQNRQPWEHQFIAGTTCILDENSKVTDKHRATKKLQHPSSPPSETRLSRAEVRRRIANKETFLVSQVEPPPTHFQNYDKHSLREEFRQAEKDHLASHALAHTWDIVSKDEANDSTQIFDCMWVYTYKSDPQGNWLRCKARLVARGDQQSKYDCGDTYAATVAIRSFRIVAALSARFDLEMKQYDAVNAYTNALLPKPVYMRMPKGHALKGCILRVLKALYGLRVSARLWQDVFSKAFIDIGFEQISDEPCVLIKDGQIVLYHVDDFIMSFPQDRSAPADETIRQIKMKFAITGGDDLSWYLGINIIRDRPNKRMWLSQEAYCRKIHKFAETQPKAPTPMGSQRLVPYEGVATRKSTHLYQRKVGSIMYAAVTTRPDVAYATGQLARFLVNPGPVHQVAADRVLEYLFQTADFALRLGAGDGFNTSSDASFGDNLPDRKSTQAYTIQLFKSLIAWKSNKQDTVTTSTTEAELLALSQASREAMAIRRITKSLDIPIEEEIINIQCDNTQTIDLVSNELKILKTKLRHVDIHNHWLKQEQEKFLEFRKMTGLEKIPLSCQVDRQLNEEEMC